MINAEIRKLQGVMQELLRNSEAPPEAKRIVLLNALYCVEQEANAAVAYEMKQKANVAETTEKGKEQEA